MRNVLVKINGVPINCQSKDVMEAFEEDFKPQNFSLMDEEQVEIVRQKLVRKWAGILTGVYLGLSMTAASSEVFAAVDGVDQIRAGFMHILDVFTAIVEPILWFYALTGCVMMATGKNSQAGWDRIKHVGYSYIAIQLIPTFFMLCRYVSTMMKDSIHF